MSELTEEILRLTQVWYKYVRLLGPHKDRDCHWYIEADFAYGNPPTYTVVHNGYIGERVSTKALNWYAANEALLFEVRKQIKEEQEWARGVVEEGLDGWNGELVEAAEFILGVDLE